MLQLWDARHEMNTYSVYPTRNAGDSEDIYKGHQTKDMNCLLFDCYSSGWIPPCMCFTDLSPKPYMEFVSWLGMDTYIYIYVHMSHVYNYISMYVQIYCIDKHHTWFSSGINSYRICLICVYIHVLCARCIKKLDQKKIRPSIEFPTMVDAFEYLSTYTAELLREPPNKLQVEKGKPPHLKRVKPGSTSQAKSAAKRLATRKPRGFELVASDDFVGRCLKDS